MRSPSPVRLGDTPNDQGAVAGSASDDEPVFGDNKADDYWGDGFVSLQSSSEPDDTEERVQALSQLLQEKCQRTVAEPIVRILEAKKTAIEEIADFEHLESVVGAGRKMLVSCLSASDFGSRFQLDGMPLSGADSALLRTAPKDLAALESHRLRGGYKDLRARYADQMVVRRLDAEGPGLREAVLRWPRTELRALAHLGRVLGPVFSFDSVPYQTLARFAKSECNQTAHAMTQEHPAAENNAQTRRPRSDDPEQQNAPTTIKMDGFRRAVRCAWIGALRPELLRPPDAEHNAEQGWQGLTERQQKILLLLRPMTLERLLSRPVADIRNALGEMEQSLESCPLLWPVDLPGEEPATAPHSPQSRSHREYQLVNMFDPDCSQRPSQQVDHAFTELQLELPATAAMKPRRSKAPTLSEDARDQQSHGPMIPLELLAGVTTASELLMLIEAGKTQLHAIASRTWNNECDGFFDARKWTREQLRFTAKIADTLEPDGALPSPECIGYITKRLDPSIWQSVTSQMTQSLMAAEQHGMIRPQQLSWLGRSEVDAMLGTSPTTCQPQPQFKERLMMLARTATPKPTTENATAANRVPARVLDLAYEAARAGVVDALKALPDCMLRQFVQSDRIPMSTVIGLASMDASDRALFQTVSERTPTWMVPGDLETARHWLRADAEQRPELADDGCRFVGRLSRQTYESFLQAHATCGRPETLIAALRSADDADCAYVVGTLVNTNAICDVPAARKHAGQCLRPDFFFDVLPQWTNGNEAAQEILEDVQYFYLRTLPGEVFKQILDWVGSGTLDEQDLYDIAIDHQPTVREEGAAHEWRRRLYLATEAMHRGEKPDAKLILKGTLAPLEAKTIVIRGDFGSSKRGLVAAEDLQDAVKNAVNVTLAGATPATMPNIEDFESCLQAVKFLTSKGSTDLSEVVIAGTKLRRDPKSHYIYLENVTATDEPCLKRLESSATYPDIVDALLESPDRYGIQADGTLTPKFARLIRRAITGAPHHGDDGAVPLLLKFVAALMFLIEPERNPSVLVTSLCLLDLIESGATYGHRTPKRYTAYNLFTQEGHEPPNPRGRTLDAALNASQTERSAGLAKKPQMIVHPLSSQEDPKGVYLEPSSASVMPGQSAGKHPMTLFGSGAGGFHTKSRRPIDYVGLLKQNAIVAQAIAAHGLPVQLGRAYPQRRKDKDNMREIQQWCVSRLQNPSVAPNGASPRCLLYSDEDSVVRTTANEIETHRRDSGKFLERLIASSGEGRARAGWRIYLDNINTFDDLLPILRGHSSDRLVAVAQDLFPLLNQDQRRQLLQMTYGILKNSPACQDLREWVHQELDQEEAPTATRRRCRYIDDAAPQLHQLMDIKPPKDDPKRLLQALSSEFWPEQALESAGKAAQHSTNDATTQDKRTAPPEKLHNRAQ